MEYVNPFIIVIPPALFMIRGLWKQHKLDNLDTTELVKNISYGMFIIPVMYATEYYGVNNSDYTMAIISNYALAMMVVCIAYEFETPFLDDKN